MGRDSDDDRIRHRDSRSKSKSYSSSRRHTHKKSRRRRHSSSRSRSNSRSRSHRHKSNRRNRSYSRSSSRDRDRSRRKRNKKSKRHRRSSSSDSSYSDKERSHSGRNSRDRRRSRSASRLEIQALTVLTKANCDIKELTESEKIEREIAIKSIGSDSFVQQPFISTAKSKEQKNSTEVDSKEEFNFGTKAEQLSQSMEVVSDGSLFSPHLFGDPVEREERYVKRIYTLRQKLLLEGV